MRYSMSDMQIKRGNLVWVEKDCPVFESFVIAAMSYNKLILDFIQQLKILEQQYLPVRNRTDCMSFHSHSLRC